MMKRIEHQGLPALWTQKKNVDALLIYAICQKLFSIENIATLGQLIFGLALPQSMTVVGGKLKKGQNSV